MAIKSLLTTTTQEFIANSRFKYLVKIQGFITLINFVFSILVYYRIVTILTGTSQDPGGGGYILFFGVGPISIILNILNLVTYFVMKKWGKIGTVLMSILLLINVSFIRFFPEPAFSLISFILNLRS